jgi:hypothetical protein
MSDKWFLYSSFGVAHSCLIQTYCRERWHVTGAGAIEMEAGDDEVSN